MVLEGGTRLVQDEAAGSSSVVSSLGPAQLTTDKDGSFGFISGRLDDDVVIWNSTMAEERGGGGDADPEGQELSGVVIVTSPFAPPHPDASDSSSGMPRVRVPAYCCYTTSTEPGTDGTRHFLLIALGSPGRTAALRHSATAEAAEMWYSVVEAAPGSGEQAVLVEEATRQLGDLAILEGEISAKYGACKTVRLPSTSADAEARAHSAAVRCALTHHH